MPQIVQPHAVSPRFVHWSDGSTGRCAKASHPSCRPRSPGERRRILARLLDSAPLQATAELHAGRSRAFQFLTETLSHPVAHRSRHFLEFARSPAQLAPPREHPRSGGPRSLPVARPRRTESSCHESSSRFDPARRLLTKDPAPRSRKQSPGARRSTRELEHDRFRLDDGGCKSGIGIAGEQRGKD